MKILRALCMATGLAISLLSPFATAQPWPARPITLVSPYPAGGITDLLSRIVGDELSKVLGQPVVVENRTGAGGAIALAYVAKAAPDGYTLVMGGSAPSVIVPALNPNAAYGPKDFEAIAFVAGLPIVLVANPAIPAANLKEFVAYAKANGGKLNCGHHGTGTGTHLSCVMFARLIGTTITDVPYKGAPQVNQDLLTNRVQFYFGTLPTEIAYVKAGQLRAYGVASPERVPALPEVPTLAEQGYAALNLDTWNALYAPAGTPRAIIARLNAEVVKILQNPEVKRKIEATSSIVRPGSAEELQKRTADEFATYRKIALEANIKID
ncbi:MAG: tripartite tricarboxylate transporter substrate binding protein [Betaproteobacteria bacterium]|nr:tripartite tricarboxylate transporter substrate binding protein [Betaproteobacteria bacterium]